MTMKKLYNKAMRFVLLFLWLACSHAVLAQERVVSGTVKDENGAAMPGVNVLVVGTSNGTVTDASGKYSISIGSGSRLLFSFIGYTSQEVAVGTSTTLDVSLKVDVTELSEIVVTGYASQEKKDLTGSVGAVKMSELTQIPSSNITNQLQGRVAGVTVTGDGRPGQPAKVRIRGMGSLTGANDPLYVIDGVPTFDIATLNPNDVESMTVLKDAGAASIYGARASNGVIIVTTKRGAKSGVKVNYDMYYGSQDPGKSPDFLANAQEYADIQWLVYRNDGTNETHPIYGPSSNPSPTFPSWAADTDWYKTITRSARIQNHDLSLQGGNENARFYTGINYFDQEGIVITNYHKRFSARLNSEFKIKDRITIGENLTITGRTQNQVAGNYEEGSPIARALNFQPIIPARMTQQFQGSSHLFLPGQYGGTGIASRLGSNPSPLADLERAADNKQDLLRLIGSAYMDVKILDYLSFRTTFGGTYGNFYNTNWAGATYERSENVATSSYNESAGVFSDWVWTNSLTFNRTFGDHKVLAVAGYESIKNSIGRGVNATRAGYFSDAFAFRTVSNGAQITGNGSYYQTPVTLTSQFLRADYSFADKYLISATVRRDGASNFGSENRYGVFPSFSAGWRISEESFLAGVEAISDLKIRGGYGTMGNQIPVSPVNQYFLFGGTVSDSNYDLNGAGTSSLQGFRPTNIGNPGARWEENTTTNIGFDAGLFDNKLQVTFDWYQKLTTGLLVPDALPGIVGAAQAPSINAGEMKNTGIDVQITYKQIVTNDLSFDANFTLTTYRNEIIKYTDNAEFFPGNFSSRIGVFSRNQVGRSMGEFYGYNVLGLFQTSGEVTGAPTQTGAEPGFFRFENIDASNNVIDPNDRTFIGNPNPDFTFGLNLTANYKNFDLTAFFYGSQGNEIFNYNRWWLDFWPSFQNQKSTRLLNESWTPTRTNTNVPKASNKSNFSTNTEATSYYVEDGSFLRLRNLQFGYRIPTSALSKIGLSSARVYVQGLNLFTATKYSGNDPDINTGDDTSMGVDFGAYPVVKTYTLGLNIGF
jgi:TonB-dependent starch-binding outer membrane protein SusC